MKAMLPLKPESICVDINKLVTDCTAAHHNMLSVLTVLALVMTLTATRFKRALETNAALPKNLVGNLTKAMKVARDSQLTVPGSLQAMALKHTGSQA